MPAYNRAGYEGATAFLAHLGDQTDELIQQLDTRCRFMAVEGKLCLVRSLLDLNLEPFGLLVLGVNETKLFKDVNSLEAV